RLANRIGIKYPNPVKVAKRIVVLIGVLVTQAFTAAIQLIMAKVGLIEGNNKYNIDPRPTPTKNNGIINPPRQPDVTVMAMATILKNKIATSAFNDKSCVSNWLIS